MQAKDGGEAIPPVVARIFSGDSTSPLTREARTWCGARDSAGLGGLVRMGSNPSGSRPNSFGRQHLTFDKGGKRGGADELFVTGNFKESVETVMKGTICF